MLPTDSAYQLLVRLVPRERIDLAVKQIADPRFELAGRDRDWRNYVPGAIKDEWAHLCNQAKVVVYALANDQASAEIWD